MKYEDKTGAILSEMLITIDGPAGSGKSTTAALLAERLGLIYLDTGAMYRSVTYAVLRDRIDPEDEVAVSAIASSIDLELRKVDGKPVFFMNGEEVESKIRGPEVSGAVSPVSRHAGVREAMVKLQRLIGAGGGMIAEGRDTGSTVFPYAHVKIFLIADIEARASRRLDQNRSLGIEQDVEEVKGNISERDRIDSSRDHSPLRKPAGAIEVDTTDISIDEQVSLIEKAVRDEAKRLASIRVWRGEKNDFAKKPVYWTITRNIILLFFRIFFGLKVTGRENLDFRENFIFTSNHLSYIDPPLVGCAVNRELWFMAKSELFRNRAFAWLISKYHAMPVRRGEADRKSIKTFTEKLQQGDSVILFPEGTRSRTGKTGKLKAGFGMIAMKTGKSVLPVFIRNSHSLRKCMLRKTRLEVHIGRPIRLLEAAKGQGRKEEYNILASMVGEQLRMLQDGSET